MLEQRSLELPRTTCCNSAASFAAIVCLFRDFNNGAGDSFSQNTYDMSGQRNEGAMMGKEGEAGLRNHSCAHFLIQEFQTSAI